VSDLVHRAEGPPRLARVELAASRRRVEEALRSLEGQPLPGARLRALVRDRPALGLGGAFVFGWALAWLLTPRRKD
jgi:hypothetical protein